MKNPLALLVAYFLLWNVSFVLSMDIPWFIEYGHSYRYSRPDATLLGGGMGEASLFFSFVAVLLYLPLLAAWNKLREHRTFVLMWPCLSFVHSLIPGGILCYALGDFVCGFSHEFETASPPLDEVFTWGLPALSASLISGLAVGVIGAIKARRKPDRFPPEPTGGEPADP